MKSQIQGAATEERPSSTPILRLKDLIVSLRGSKSWDAMIGLLHSVLNMVNKGQSPLRFFKQNWEVLSSLVETIFQALLSGSYGQVSAGVQGLLCILAGHRNCSFNMNWLQQLLKILESKNWKPVIKVQTGTSVAGHGRVRPFNMAPGALKGKPQNITKLNSAPSEKAMQSFLQVLLRSSNGKENVGLGVDKGREKALWEGLEELRQSLLKNVGSSVYANFKRKVSRMTDSLVDEVSSVIGVPHSDTNGKCSVGDLRQLLLWGIKNNITWNAQTLGFSSHGLLTKPPFLSCKDASPDEKRILGKSHKVTKKSVEREAEFEDGAFFMEVIDAVCNESIPGLPGVSNFTVYLYCNLFNGDSQQSVPDLGASCSDAAWYLSATEEDSIWVGMCSEYYTAEFNATVCRNSSFTNGHQPNPNQPLVEQLCTHLPNSTREPADSQGDCDKVFKNTRRSREDFMKCFLQNDTSLAQSLCSNETFKKSLGEEKAWIWTLCRQYDLNANPPNSSVTENAVSCEYKTWNFGAFRNASLVDTCKDAGDIDFKNSLCKSSSLYQSLVTTYPWIVDYCAESSKNSSENEKCFLQKLVEMLPVPYNFDSSQLCVNPSTFLMEAFSQLTECEDESHSWILNVNYILRVLDFLLDFSSLDEGGKEVRKVLSQAILLSNLLDNASFWDSFRPNASLLILRTVGAYLKKEQNSSVKNDLLSCFSPVLWDLLQNEENSSAVRVLFKEYLRMSDESFRMLLMSVEQDTVKRFLSLMHRAWYQLQQLSRSDEPAMETMTSAFLQKFPRMTPEIFVDFSQFIPFMSISDIINLPTSLLVNDTVLTAIRDHSTEMKKMQKRAFAKRLLQSEVLGGISFWPPPFLRSIQPLLPHLPLCRFQQLKAEQLQPALELLRDARLDIPKGRHVVRAIFNRNKNVTTEEMKRLGNLICFLELEDLQLFLLLQRPLDILGTKLLECLSNRTLNPHGRVAYYLAQALSPVNLSAMTPQDLVTWRGLLPQLGVDIIQKLSSNQTLALLSGWRPTEIMPSQAFQLVKQIVAKVNVTTQIFCSLLPALHGLNPEVLKEIPAPVLVEACPCLGSALSRLSPAQKAAMLEAVKMQKDAADWLVRLSCLLPLVPLKDLTLGAEFVLENLYLAQYIFKKVWHASNRTKDLLMTLGNLAGGLDCETLLQWKFDSDFIEIVKFVNEQHNGLRAALIEVGTIDSHLFEMAADWRKCIVETLLAKTNLPSKELNQLGPELLADLPLRMIDALSNQSMRLILEHVSKHMTCFLELQPHKQSRLTERVLQLLGVTLESEITGKVLDLIGPLVPFVEDVTVTQISRDSLLLRLDELRSYCLSQEFSDEFGRILTEESMLGDPSGWSLKETEQAGRLLFTLTQEHIYSLPKELVRIGLVEQLLDSQRRWESSDLGQICSRRVSRLDLELKGRKQSLVSRIVRPNVKGRREPIPSCADIKATFPAAWNSVQLRGMSAPDFQDCLEMISLDENLSVEQLQAALIRVKQVFGPLKKMRPEEILQLGRLVTQLSEKELQEIDVTQLGVVTFLGEKEGWSNKQMKALFSSFLRRRAQSLPELGVLELAALGYLICGLKPEEMAQINPEEFSKAILYLGSLTLPCSEAQLESLASLASSDLVFGPISGWGPEVFTEIGNLAAGLPDIVLSSLVKLQIEGLTPDAIAVIPAGKFAVVFSADQLLCLTSAQAAAVTPLQYQLLSPEQRQAVSKAKYEGEVAQDHRGKNSVGLLISPTAEGMFLVSLCIIHNSLGLRFVMGGICEF
ncbi:stereocilin [Latimeria chalumnae]|uniref:stereocilin n=1 Tax=Latimeria chalumnae TaxID=7897 RepID=UPI00313B3BF8